MNDLTCLGVFGFFFCPKPFESSGTHSKSEASMHITKIKYSPVIDKVTTPSDPISWSVADTTVTRVPGGSASDTWTTRYLEQRLHFHQKQYWVLFTIKPAISGFVTLISPKDNAPSVSWDIMVVIVISSS